MTEKPIGAIEAILNEYPSLLWHHCPDSRGCQGMPGLPDFVIISPYRSMIWREVKPHAGEHPHGGQLTWKYTIQAIGMDWSVWTIADVDSGRVRREIEALL
jgi:hypothetical protein